MNAFRFSKAQHATNWQRMMVYKSPNSIEIKRWFISRFYWALLTPAPTWGIGSPPAGGLLPPSLRDPSNTTSPRITSIIGNLPFARVYSLPRVESTPRPGSLCNGSVQSRAHMGLSLASISYYFGWAGARPYTLRAAPRVT